MSLKEAFENNDKKIRCYPPYTLRIFAITEESNGRKELAEKYKRMAYAREYLWQEYCRKCLELEE